MRQRGGGGGSEKDKEGLGARSMLAAEASDVAAETARADAISFQSELDGARVQLAAALADKEIASSELLRERQRVEALSAQLELAVAAVAAVAAQTAVTAVSAPAAEEGQLQQARAVGDGRAAAGGSGEDGPTPSPADGAAEAVVELQMELISCKMRAAESEYELEELRGKVSRMGKQLKRLGCVEHSSFEQAKLTTSMEVRLAQALSESAWRRQRRAAGGRKGPHRAESGARRAQDSGRREDH